MLFNSYEFIFIFLPSSLVIYFLLNKYRLIKASKIWIIIVSLFFYSWWNVNYLPLILSSILFNFIVGSVLSARIGSQILLNALTKKSFLIFGIMSNLCLLFYFKYTNFFIENIDAIFGLQWELLNIILPLGISFFTFTQIAYLVDAYRGEVKNVDYLNYTLFVTFFPHLLAGPILHHKEMMPQFDALKNKLLNYKNISFGIFLFSIGLFKKVVIADTFALWANAGFETTDILNFFEAWTTSLSYTFQLYFDFSGYTDMALGVALMFNIYLPINFNSPYKAINIQDFWRRWHITLSRFLKEYIYIPLGGNKQGEINTYFYLFIVFFIGGLWHGASWMFVMWGTLHGMAIVIHRLWKKTNICISDAIAWTITFNFVNFAWIFFRSKDWDHAFNILSGMFGLNGIVVSKAFFIHNSWTENSPFFGICNVDSQTVIYLVSAFIIVLLMPNSQTMLKNFVPSWKSLLLTLSFLIYGIFNLSKISEFLYFTF